MVGQMRVRRRLFVASLCVVAPALVRQVAAQQPPATPKRPVIDTYHGVQVTDDYRWLENANDPEVRQWVKAQNEYTRSILDRSPIREAVAKELAALFSKRGTRYRTVKAAAGRLFAIKREPARQQPELVTLSSVEPNAVEKVVFDPLKLDAGGAISMDFYVPSHDARYVAVSLSRLGSEAGDVHVFEVATGRELRTDTVLRVNGGTAGGSVAWNGDNTGFFYTRYPRAGERPPVDLDFYQQVYFHRLGTPEASDRYETGKDFPRIAEIQLQSSDDGKWVLATIQNGDGGDYFHLVHSPDGEWRRITSYADQISVAKFGLDDSLFLLSRQDAPMRKVLRLAAPFALLQSATTVIQQSDAAIEDFEPTVDCLYVTYMAGGPSEVTEFDLKGKPIGKLPLTAALSVDELERIGPKIVLFEIEGYITAPRWVCWSSGSRELRTVETLSPPYPISFGDAEVVREFATSRDGTRVPLNIIRRKGTMLDGKNPVLLTGYGGYALSETPHIDLINRLLLDHGVVIVTTNLRGGAEYGEQWHENGRLTRKQNVFDDFYACAQHAVDQHYTTPARLAIMGGSNGGLLMGAELTQHPEMYRVVLAFVGIYDMLRAELSPNGAFNVTEYGTVKELDQFRALYAYSPYHRVVDGKEYPAAVFLTGDNDPRVDPANSRKMVARLQAADHSKGPILLRTTSKAGHGFGSSLNEVVAQFTDAYAFLFDQLGVK
jgi:prolyl oligopeptidase